MATQLQSPGTMANDNSFGLHAWIDPDNAKTSNDTYTTSTNSSTAYDSSSSQYLVATNLGFSIPTGATINGIVVELEMKANYLDANKQVSYYNGLSILKESSIVGTPENGSSPYQFPTTEAYKTFGSSSSLWGTTWTSSDINDSGFGIRFKTNLQTNNNWNSTSYTIIASIDHIRITVYYTEEGTSTNTTNFFQFIN